MSVARLSTYLDAALTQNELLAISRRCWHTVRGDLGLPVTSPIFDTDPRDGYKLGDHTAINAQVFLLDQQLTVSLKSGDIIDDAFRVLADLFKSRRPTACAPLPLPAGVEHAFRMRCGRDSLSIRCVQMYVMWPADFGAPGWRSRFDILCAGKTKRSPSP